MAILIALAWRGFPTRNFLPAGGGLESPDSFFLWLHNDLQLHFRGAVPLSSLPFPLVPSPSTVFMISPFSRMMEAVSDEQCLPFMRDLCLQLLANVTRVQVT